jgi:signal transduction histidine kinase
MGLGLAMVKSIVEEFKGKIWFETKRGEGSIFYVTIPAV